MLPTYLGVMELNLALAWHQARNPDAARAHLAASRDAWPEADPDYLFTGDDLLARLDLEAGRPALALEAWRDLHDRAVVANATAIVWRSLLGQADADAALSHPDRALAHHEAARAILFRSSFLVPIDLGRDAFLEDRRHAFEQHVTLLLDLGRIDDAAALARSERSTYLAGLQQPARLAGLGDADRAAWASHVAEYDRIRARLGERLAERDMAPSDEVARLEAEADRLAREAHLVLDRGLSATGGSQSLTPRAPLPGEVMLTWTPTPTGWLAFAVTERGARMARLPPPDADEALQAWLFSPFQTEIRAARRVTLLPTDVLRSRDIHHRRPVGLLPLDGPDVQYALDIPGRTPDATSGPPRRALVVSDARGDLAQARQEGEETARALMEAGVAVTHLAGADATRTAVLQALADADLLHVAGHGATASDVLDAHLLLARGGDLTVADILALAHAPRVVVLTGCETARSVDSVTENLGIAQAFLTAGSDVVVAATRPIGDARARAIAQRFYEAWQAGTDPAHAFSLASRSSDADTDASSFRVLRP